MKKQTKTNYFMTVFQTLSKMHRIQCLRKHFSGKWKFNEISKKKWRNQTDVFIVCIYGTYLCMLLLRIVLHLFPQLDLIAVECVCWTCYMLWEH